MIKYRDRIGVVTYQGSKGLDLYLFPCSRYPEPKMVVHVTAEEVEIAEFPLRKEALAQLPDSIKRGHIVRMREGETREEALKRGRAEIAEEAAEEELPTDEVGRMPSELDAIFGAD